MAFKLNESQLSLTLDDSGAKPDLVINPANVIFHLTKGFSAGNFPQAQGNALTAKVRVPVTGTQSGEEFGFVQIGRANFFGAFYAGRIPSEGSVAVLAHVPPALANPVMLDAIGHPPIPFFEDDSGAITDGVVNAKWGDHPALRTPLKLRNSSTDVNDFLFHLIDDREFWTIFTVFKPGVTPPQYVAHFHWQVRYDVQFMWINERATAKTKKSFIKVHVRNGKGRPLDPDIQAMLNNPVDPRASEAFGKAITSSFFGARGANRSENKTRFNNVPADFWS